MIISRVSGSSFSCRRCEAHWGRVSCSACDLEIMNLNPIGSTQGVESSCHSWIRTKNINFQCITLSEHIHVHDHHPRPLAGTWGSSFLAICMVKKYSGCDLEVVSSNPSWVKTQGGNPHKLDKYMLL